MKPREIKRLHLIRQALEQRISQKQAAEVAGLSPRQMRRLMKRVVAEGDRGILHRRRGKPSNRRIADKTKQKVLELFEKHYPDYGPTLASEKLHERHRIEIHPETLRLWLRQARLPYKQRKARPHRQWRERRSCFGEIAQSGKRLVELTLFGEAANLIERRRRRRGIDGGLGYSRNRGVEKYSEEKSCRNTVDNKAATKGHR